MSSEEILAFFNPKGSHTVVVPVVKNKRPGTICLQPQDNSEGVGHETAFVSH